MSRYTKGNTPWNKGMKMPADYGQVRGNKRRGQRHSEESKRIMSEKKMGHSVSQSTRDAVRKSLEGKFGDISRNWRGGKRINTHKYILVYMPEHPYSNKSYVFEHRYVMEQHLDRFLTPDERVHHINGDRKDNRIENLCLLESNSAHRRLHSTMYELVYELYEKGVIGFDDKRYYIK